jgi:hypothetical protein
LSIDFDKVGAAARAIICGEHREHTLVKHLDSFGRVMESVADGHSEIWVLGVFNIPLGALLEVVLVGLDMGFKSGNLLFEVSLLLNMVLLPNSDGTDQRGGNPSEHNCIDVSFHGKGCGDGAGGTQLLKRWGSLDLWFREGKGVGRYGVR